MKNLKLKNRKIFCIAFAMLFACVAVLGLLFSLPVNRKSVSAAMPDDLTYTWDIPSNQATGVFVQTVDKTGTHTYTINLSFPYYTTHSTTVFTIELYCLDASGRNLIVNGGTASSANRPITSAESVINVDIGGVASGTEGYFTIFLHAGSALTSSNRISYGNFIIQGYLSGKTQGSDNINKGFLQYIDKMVTGNFSPDDFSAGNQLPLTFENGILQFNSALTVNPNIAIAGGSIGIHFDRVMTYETLLSRPFENKISFIYPNSSPKPTVYCNFFNTTRDSISQVSGTLVQNSLGQQIFTTERFVQNPYAEQLDDFTYNVVIFQFNTVPVLDADFEYGITDAYTQYSLGYSQGSHDGYKDGYAEGNASGKQSGYEEGYNVGFNRGQASASNYTFFSLMSSVVDAPVKAFTGMLDFNILGFNLKTVLLSLLSCVLLLKIISVFSKGR